VKEPGYRTICSVRFQDWGVFSGCKIFVGEKSIRITGTFSDEIPFSKIEKIEDIKIGVIAKYCAFTVEYVDRRGKRDKMRVDSWHKPELLIALHERGFEISGVEIF